MQYFLAVDGGNTKTDYVVLNGEGQVLSYHRAGTCSRENIGYAGASRALEREIGYALCAAGIELGDVTYAALGLAGVDTREHLARMEEIVRAIGIERFVVSNDAFLGVKAGCPDGVGVCSINGTETSAGGMDAAGSMVQIAGLRAISGDDAGGTRIAEMALNLVYDEVYRFGDKTLLTPLVLQLFHTDARGFHEAVSTMYLDTVKPLDVIVLLFEAADKKDALAAGLVEHVARVLAKNAAACAVRLSLPTPVPVVLAGSVWTKGRYAPMLAAFELLFERYAGRPAKTYLLSQPPVAGAALWALERGGVQGMREKVLQNIRNSEPSAKSG